MVMVYQFVLFSDHIILQSAKHNLEHELAFFGLTEYMADTQFIFEHIFGLRFRRDFPMPDEISSKSANTPVTDEERQQLRAVNYLDVQLYEFAKKLFFDRLSLMKRKFEPMTSTSVNSTSNSTENLDNINGAHSIAMTNSDIRNRRNKWQKLVV